MLCGLLGIIIGVIWYLTEWGRLTKAILMVSMSVIAALPDVLRDLGVTMNLVAFFFLIQLLSLIIIKCLNVHYAAEEVSPDEMEKWERRKGLYHIFSRHP